MVAYNLRRDCDFSADFTLNCLFNERTDLTYEGIATLNTPLLKSQYLVERTDLTYEGIATLFRQVSCTPRRSAERTDLTYEGIATAADCCVICSNIRREPT